MSLKNHSEFIWRGRCYWIYFFAVIALLHSCNAFNGGPRLDSIPISYDAYDVTEGSGSGNDAVNNCGDGKICHFGGVCLSDAEGGPCLCMMFCMDQAESSVCGTDGRSYYNECYLKKASCEDQVYIEVEHIGRCKHTGEQVVSDSSQTSQNCAVNPSMPLLTFTDEESCNTDTNCRYGGVCWKNERCLCTWHCRNYPERSKSNPELNVICGTDGRTYSDECELRLAACRCQSSITVKWKGSCEQGPRLDSIPISYDAYDVTEGSGSGNDAINNCGDGKICHFGGVCSPDAEGGPCLCMMFCMDQAESSVCGTDGRSYYNECYLKKASCEDQVYIEVEHIGRCKHTGVTTPPVSENDASGEGSADVFDDDEDTLCDTLNCEGDVIKPVCGSDGNDYTNHCVLRHVSCISGIPLRVVHSGFCDPYRDLPEKTDKSNNPLEATSACDVVYCLHGATCFPKGTDDFECSCDLICSEGSLMAKQTSLAHMGKITMNQLAEFLPEIRTKSRYDEEQELFETKQRIISPSVIPLMRSSIQPMEDSVSVADGVLEPIIDSLDDVAELKPVRLIRKGGYQGYVGDDFDYTQYERHFQEVSEKRHFRSHRGGRSHRVRRSFRDSIQYYFNDTVCGDDGKTYRDECQMRIHACHEKKTIKIKKIGACPYVTKEKEKMSSSISVPTTTRQVTSTKLSEQPKSANYRNVQRIEIISTSSLEKLALTSDVLHADSDLWKTRESAQEDLYTVPQPSRGLEVKKINNSNVPERMNTEHETTSSSIENLDQLLLDVDPNTKVTIDSWVVMFVSIALVLATGVLLLGLVYFCFRAKQTKTDQEVKETGTLPGYGGVTEVMAASTSTLMTQAAAEEEAFI